MENIEPLQKPNNTKTPLPVKTSFIPTTDLLKLTNFDSKQLGDALRLLSSELGISASAARKILYKMASSGKIASFADLKAFMSEQSPIARPLQAPDRFQRTSQVVDQQNAVANRNSANIFRAGLRIDMPQAPSNFTAAQSTDNTSPEQLPVERQILSQLVTSPKAFASWLVNNRAAFASLQTNPRVTYLLTALANPNLQMSPLMLAELAKLLAVLAKLKLGNSASETLDEVATDDKEQEILLEENDRGHNVVDGVRNAISTKAVTPLKDFLLEAERFAEEEIANLWSLTLKKEKAVEQEVLSRFDKLSKQR